MVTRNVDCVIIRDNLELESSCSFTYNISINRILDTIHWEVQVPPQSVFLDICNYDEEKDQEFLFVDQVDIDPVDWSFSVDSVDSIKEGTFDIKLLVFFMDKKKIKIHF
jgi:hypothetical protein